MVTEALVNKQTGEVMEIGLQKTPDEIMLDARDAALALEKLIASNKRKPVEFNGKRHLEFAHWQTVARFFHTSASTDEAQFVEVGGVKGFKARATVMDEKTGIVVGGAEAYCMMDEPNWKNKPLFQLASMAQTRAACKALSNKYRYVAILAGYEPTPSEEMNEERILQAPKELVAVEEIEFGQAPPGVGPDEKKFITPKQRSLIFAKCRAANIGEDLVKVYMKENFAITSTSDLQRDQLDQLLKWIDGFKPA